MIFFRNLYSSTIRTIARKRRFLETSFPNILHFCSIPSPGTERIPIPCATAAYMPRPTFCNFVNLLSTDKRDYLIRNNGQKVKIDSLNGKFVALLYLTYSVLGHELYPFPGLLEAYKTLHPKGDFEVVIVALNKKVNEEEDSYEWMFNNDFEKMPWLAVPYSDFGTRKCVRDDLSLPPLGTCKCMILDKLGNVVSRSAYYCFEVYGANYYPFTSQRIDELCKELATSVKKPSLINLLSSPSRDYLLTRNGDKVAIADLESKVVGLYFFDLHYGGALLTIRSAYDQLKANGMDFEIVFLNRHGRGDPDGELFNKNFEEMPWLAVPFGEITCEKLAFALGIDAYRYQYTSLVIIKPGECCDLYGYDIIKKYGIEAYPFTLEKVAEIEIERLSLLSLFDAEGQDFVIQNDYYKTKIKMSNLKRNSARVCMLVAANVPSEIMSHLINWYNEMKEVYARFEVIYVSRCKSITEFDDIFKQMPPTWLALPFGTGDIISDMLGYWGEEFQDVMVAAFFQPDGTYLTKLSLDNFDELFSNNNYPFNADIDTMREMCSVLSSDEYWSYS